MFKDKFVLVTGGSRGIGRAIVEELASRGANLVFTYNTQKEASESLIEDLCVRYPEQDFLARQCDSRNGNECTALLALIDEDLGGIDVLVNNAGISRDNLLMSMSDEEWHEVIDINLNGIFHFVRSAVFQMMKKRSGSIINITSVSGVYGNAGQTNYAAAKAGIIGFTKALSKEVVEYGIRVNAVAPGYIKTDMTASLSDAQKDKFLKTIGMGRMGTPAEVAKAVAFLASNEASYVTGQVLSVDGGIVL